MIRRTSHALARIVALATPMLLGSQAALALDPSLHLTQSAHTGWRIRDGFSRGTVVTIAQTPDGYLWLGTESGLLRFDGVRAVPWAGAELPASYITALRVTRDGTLWIATRKGLASLRDGKLTHHPEVAGRLVLKLREGHDGTLWFAAVDPAGGQLARLCSVEAAKIRCEEHADLGKSIFALYPDSRGNLWVSTQTGLWRWKPGPPEHYVLAAPVTEANDLVEDDDGALLLATNDGLKRLAGGTIRPHPLPGLDAVPRPRRLVRSSDGSLWIATYNGLVHVHRGKADLFGVEDGLSHEHVMTVFEDREANLWVSTMAGLDRFRDYEFPTFSARQGLGARPWALQATADGSIWVSATDGLSRWQGGLVTLRGDPAASAQGDSTRAASARDGNAGSLAVDARGRLWAANGAGVFFLEEDRFVRAKGLPGGTAYAIASDRLGGAWVSLARVGLFHGTAGGGVDEVPWIRFGKSNGAAALLLDPANEGLWLGFAEGGVSRFEDGKVTASYAPTDGLGTGRVSHLRSGEQGTVWAATESGLSRIASGHVLTMTAKNGLPCDAVQWSMEDDDRSSVWLYMPCGLVRVARSGVDAWVKNPELKIDARVFDASDGIRTVGSPGAYGPPVTKAPDGRIWFTPNDGVTLIDPRRLQRNDPSPPVDIQQITADGEAYDASAARGGPLRLAAGVRDLAIDYAALSLAVPEKVRYRIKLQGQDADFREVGNERHARYTNLPPGDYRFLVKAASHRGALNEGSASLDFTIPPAWYETAWFRALCLAALSFLLWAAYRIRVRFLQRHQKEITALNERLMAAQEEERSRIAGELHDGIVQQITTTNLLLGVATRQLPPGAKALIDEAQEALLEMGADVRQLSHELHPALLKESGLPGALCSYCREFSKTRSIPVFCEAEDGVKELSPGSALALYRIAQEALGNAAKHAKASQIRVRLTRADGIVRLTVADDGVGFVPRGAGNGGGVGLVNMRERVRQLNGALALESEPGRGTTVRAEIPFRPA